MKRRITLEQKRSIHGVLFCIPFILGLALIFFPALINAVVFSFNQILISAQGYTLKSVGFSYYNKALFENAYFVRRFVESLTAMATNVPLILAFSFFMSGLLNSKFKGRTVVRAIFFLPVVITAGVIVKVENIDALETMMNQTQGAGSSIGQMIDSSALLLSIGIDMGLVNYFFGILNRIYEIITNSGVQIIIFLAALQTIPPSLYEASSMEGATNWENFWKITFPMLTPYILTNVVYTIIDFLGSYRNPVMAVINEEATGTHSDLSYSLAMSMIYFAGASVVMFIIVLIVSRIVFYYD